MLQRVKILKTPVRAEYPTDLAETYSVDVASQGLQIPPPGPRRPRFARPARAPGRNPTRQLSLGTARRFAPGCAREKQNGVLNKYIC